MANLYKSARGKTVDMNRLSSQNELTVAVSNIKINARGDELGANGQIIRKNNESLYRGVPVDAPNTNSRSAVTRAVQPAIITQPEVIAQPEIELPNALVDTKPLEKPSKGK